MKKQTFILGFFVLLFLLSISYPYWLGLSASEIHLKDSYLAPFQSGRYFLGTDKLGKDVLAMLLEGYKTAFLISLPIMLLASAIGLSVGAWVGYYGDNALKSSPFTLLFKLLLISLTLFEILIGRQIPLTRVVLKPQFVSLVHEFSIIAGIIGLTILFIWGVSRLHQYIPQKYLISIPLDQVFLRVTEILSSIPRLVLILCLAALLKPSVFNFGFIILTTYWITPAKLMRAEIIRIKQMNFIEAAKAQGFNDFGILFKQALPNTILPVLINFVFGLAGLISLESTLSFLGIGLPPETISWGRTMASANYSFTYWWLLVFPIICLVSTVMLLHMLISSDKKSGLSKDKPL